MNKVILMGRITKDPELSQSMQGAVVTRFSIAVNRPFAKEGSQQVDFVNCVAWENKAEFICKHFKKGSMIAVVGKIQVRSWDSDDGKKYATEIIIDEVHFTGEKKNDNNIAENDSDVVQSFPNDDFTDISNDDNLPF